MGSCLGVAGPFHLGCLALFLRIMPDTRHQTQETGLCLHSVPAMWFSWCWIAAGMLRAALGADAHLRAHDRAVLQDWNRGKLKYYTLPPLEEEKFASVIESTGSPPSDFSASSHRCLRLTQHMHRTTVVDQLGTAFQLFPQPSTHPTASDGVHAEGDLAPRAAEEDEENKSVPAEQVLPSDGHEGAAMPDTHESEL